MAKKIPNEDRDDYATEAKRLRFKTRMVTEILSCNQKTLWNWERMCPRLFTPVLRQHNGNIYRWQQIRIMAEVMDGLIDPETGAELSAR